MDVSMTTPCVRNRASIVAALSVALVLAGCGASPTTSGGSSPTAATSASTSPTATPSPQESPSPVASTTPQPRPRLPEVFTCADASGGSAQAGTQVVGVRVGEHDGYDRPVVELS